ncbi:MAG: leucine-rich repeat protein [Muribaculaceae bacterium]|nr:leucine-rich repeat protein [Muribaculaceae bacterium]
MRKTLLLILMAVLSALPCALRAATVTVDVDNLRYTVNTTAGTAEVAGLATEVEITDLVIPDYIEYSGSQYPVTSIGNQAFWNCTSLTGSLTIGNNVTYIGGSAFYGCSGFNGTLTLSDNITSIGESAFSSCSGFTGSLTLPDKLMTLEAKAFHNCPGFTGSLTIPDNVTSISNSAFTGCSGFNGSLTIPENVTSIGESAFLSCSGFSGPLAIPENVTSIGKQAFYACAGFSGPLIIPENVTSIGDRAFEYCSGFSGSLTIPNNVTSIGNYSFHNCTGLSGSLTISDNVTSIGDYVFDHCSGFTGPLVIPDNVTSIGLNAFASCSGFSGTLTIPEAVNRIGSAAFLGCDNISQLEILSQDLKITRGAFHMKGLESITCSAITPPSFNYNGYYNSIFDPSSYSRPLYVPAESVEAYKTTTEWENFTKINPVNATAIDLNKSELALPIGGSETLVATVTPENATDEIIWSVNADPAGCVTVENGKVTAIALGTATVTATCGEVFASCSVTISSAATVDLSPLHYAIDFNAGTAEVVGLADGVTSVTDLVIPDYIEYFGTQYPVTSIRDYAFWNCTSLSDSLTIGNNVTSIGDYAFYGCSGFSGSLIIPKNVTSIGARAFYECLGFTGSLIIPENVTSIGQEAFYRCSGLTGSLIIPENVTSMGAYAFYECSGFTGSLTIPNNFTSIVNGAFAGCSGFTGSLIIPENITSIGDWAFSSCSGFTGSLTIPDNITSIGEGAFSRCSGLTGSLTIPDNVTSISDYAFNKCSGFTGSLIIPENVISIGLDAFRDCSGFTGSLIIPNNVTSIGEGAFRDCSGFTGSLTIPENVTSIGKGAFYNCSGFSGSLTIPYNITSISDYAFYYCSGFTGSLIIPENVTSIGQQAFFECSGFTGSLTIPENVTSIDRRAFSQCFNITQLQILSQNLEINSGAFDYMRALESITCSSTTPPTCILDDYYNVFPSSSYSKPLYVPEASVEAYKTSTEWEKFTNINPVFATGIVLNQSELILPVGGSETLVATVTPENATDEIIWSVNADPAGCVTVENGKVTAIALGTATVTATCGEVSVTCSVSIRSSATVDLTPLRYVIDFNAGTAEVVGLADGITGVTDLTIPDHIEYSGAQYPVTAIGNNAFYSYEFDSKIAGTLTIGQNIISIGENAFAYCSGCTGSLIIPDNVTSIGKSAFSDCSGFTGSLIISKNITSIERATFADCSGFTGSLVIPDKVTSIGELAFTHCSGFTGSLIIPKTVTLIGTGAFQNCSGLTGALIIPENITSIEGHAFRGCSKLTGTLIIPEKVTSIGYRAFLDCSGFNNELIIPESVNKIEAFAFEGYNNITSLLIRSHSLKVSYGAFNMSRLQSVTCEAITPPSCTYGEGITNVFSNLNYSKPLYVPTESVEAYKTATEWEKFTNVNPVYATGIALNKAALALPVGGSETLVATVTPENATDEIVWSVNAEPAGCVTVENGKVTAIALGTATVTATCGEVSASCSVNILSSATVDLSPLRYAIDFNTVTAEVVGLADGVDSVTDLVIPDYIEYLGTQYPVTSIGNNAFYSSGDYLKGSLTIGKNVTSIGDYAFQNCSGFNGSLTIPDKVTFIGKSAFYYCSGLSGSLTLGNNVSEIGSSAFLGCFGFTGSLTLPDNITSISEGIFSYCSGFTGSLIIPEKVTSIGERAFAGCSGFTGTLTIPASVREIAPAAFSSCSQLSKLEILSQDLVIHDGAFRYINTFESVTCSAITPPTCIYDDNNNFIFNSSSYSKPLYVPEESVEAYKTATEWEKFTNINPVYATGIALNKAALALPLGGSETLVATVTPENTTDEIVWSVTAEPEGCVSVENGKVTAIALGTATVTATAGNVSASCLVTVNPIVASSVIIDQGDVTMLIGGQQKFTATVQPANTTDPTIVWSSDNEAVAKVAADGTVTAVAVGTANIKASCGEVSATCKVTVNPIVASTVSIDHMDLTLVIGEQGKLTATVQPSNTTDPTIVWSSDNEAVAKVAADGTVTAVAAGTTNIKASCGEASASCKVTVTGIQLPQPTVVKDYRNQCVNVTDAEAQRISVKIGQETKTMDLPASIAVDPSMTELIITAQSTDANRTDSEPLTVALEFFKAPQISYNGHSVQFSLVDVPAGQPAPELVVYQDGNLLRVSTELTGFDITGFGSVAAAVQSDYMFRSAKSELAINYFNTGTEAGARNGARLKECFGTWGDHSDDYTNLHIIGEVNREDLALLATLPDLKTLNLDASVAGSDSYDNVFSQSDIETLALTLAPAGLLKGMERLTTVIWNRTDAKMPDGIISGNGNPNILVWVNDKNNAPADASNVVTFRDLQGGLITSDDSRCQASAEKIALASGKPYNAFKQLQAGHVELTKEFTQKTQIGVCRGWETLAVPFLPSKVTHESKGEMIPFALWDGQDNGPRPYWLYRSTSTGWIHASAIEPGVPYIISVPNNPEYLDIFNLEGKVTFSADNVTLGSETSQPRSTDWVDGSKFIATFMPVEGNIWSLNSGEESADLLPGSAFVAGLPTQPFGGYVMSSSAQRVLPLFSDSDALWMPVIAGNGDLIVESPAPGTLRILSSCDRTVTVYTVTGAAARIVQLQAGEVVTVEHLARGFYFVGHQKVVVR